jgi:diacylglycerol O-acyltransferase / wax synthase
LPGLPDGRLGLYFKLHHATTDGAAGVAAVGALLDFTAEPTALSTPRWTPAPIPTPPELLYDTWRRRRQALGRARSSLTDPTSALRRSRSVVPMWREFFAERRAHRTSLNRPIGDGRQLAIIRGQLDLTKQIAHVHHATVNDLVLAAVAAGLRDLLRARGERVEELVPRAMVPIALRATQPGQVDGNRDSAMIAPLPIGEPDQVRRLQLIAAETADRRHKTRPQGGPGSSDPPSRNGPSYACSPVSG